MPKAGAVPPRPRAVFENLRREHDFEEVQIEGKVPKALQGTLYRNGVGLMEQFGRRYQHLFEADGAISALKLEEGRAFAAARLVQSAGLLEERAAGRHLRSYAASWPRRLWSIHGGGRKNTANTHVIAHQGRLLALMEGGKPTAIDPQSLRTLGETDFDGVIPGAFSAHPHRVASRKSLFGFGMSYGRTTTLNVFALPDSGAPRKLWDLPLERPVMLHDFIATESHLVFFVCPMRVLVWRMLLGLPGFAECIRFTPEDGTEIIVMPIDEPERVTRFHTEAFHTFHFGAAFDDGDDIVVDYVRYPDGSLLGALGDGSTLDWHQTPSGGTLHRARISPKRKSFASEVRFDASCEFPRIAPQVEGHRHKHLWLLSECQIDGLFRHRITRVDDDGQAVHHTLSAGELCSEPVPAQWNGVDEDGGSILCFVFCSFNQRTHLLVLDARSLEVQARVPLTQAIPLTFHGSWVSR